MGRVNVSLRNDLIKAVEDYASKNGRTVSAVIGEATSIFLESRESGIRPEDIIKAFNVLMILREIDSVPVPSTLLDALIHSSLETSGDKILEKWKERGVILGNILRKYAKTLPDFARFITEYRDQIPVNVFSIEIAGEEATVIISGAGYSRDAARCTAEGLSGFLSSYGYRAYSTEFSEGFVKILATRIS